MSINDYKYAICRAAGVADVGAIYTDHYGMCGIGTPVLCVGLYSDEEIERVKKFEEALPAGIFKVTYTSVGALRRRSCALMVDGKWVGRVDEIDESTGLYNMPVPYMETHSDEFKYLLLEIGKLPGVVAIGEWVTPSFADETLHVSIGVKDVNRFNWQDCERICEKYVGAEYVRFDIEEYKELLKVDISSNCNSSLLVLRGEWVFNEHKVRVAPKQLPVARHDVLRYKEAILSAAREARAFWVSVGDVCSDGTIILFISCLSVLEDDEAKEVMLELLPSSADWEVSVFPREGLPVLGQMIIDGGEWL